MKKPVVAIIMATYNGARFIQEQIDSILNQQGVDVHFYISDDGSSDSTLDIINQYFNDNDIGDSFFNNRIWSKSNHDFVNNIIGNNFISYIIIILNCIYICERRT